MDIMGPYTPALGGKRYILVAVDYFTKWVEAEPVKNIKTKGCHLFHLEEHHHPVWGTYVYGI